MAITRVQSLHGAVFNSANCDIGTGQPTVPGNSIFGCIGMDIGFGQTFAGMADDQGQSLNDAYRIAGVVEDLSNSQRQIWFYSLNNQKPVGLISAYTSDPSFIVCISWEEFAGFGPSIAFDKFVGQPQTGISGADAASSGPLATALDNEFLWAFCLSSGGATTRVPTPNGAWTAGDNGTGPDFATAWRLAGAHGNFTALFDAGAVGANITGQMAFSYLPPRPPQFVTTPHGQLVMPTRQIVRV